MSPPPLRNDLAEVLADHMGKTLYVFADWIDEVGKFEPAAIDEFEDIFSILYEFPVVHIQIFNHRPGRGIIFRARNDCTRQEETETTGASGVPGLDAVAFVEPVSFGVSACPRNSPGPLFTAATEEQV